MQLSSYEKLGKWRTRQTVNHRFAGVSAKLLASNFDEASTVRVL
jgi:hypothetical protein